MTSLIKELARGDQQLNLKTSDGSDAGQNDVTGKPVDVRFNLMRNMINTNGGVTGSDVNDYLERAHELNDEVDTVGFAIETDDGDYIKVYVNATQADEFEQEMSKLLGLDDDSESAINTLAQKFDIVDVVWPQDPDGDGEAEDGSVDPYADVSIDDDPSAFMGDDAVDAADDEAEVDSTEEPVEDDELATDALSADYEVDAESDESKSDDSEEKPKKKSLMKDIVGGSKDKEEKESEAKADDEISDELPDDGSKDETSDDEEESTEGDSDNAPEKIDTDDEVDDEDEEDDGEEELDADGNPIKKEKKPKKKEGEKEVTEEGLKLGKLSALAEAARDEITAHIAREQAARANKIGKFVIDCLMTGGTMGRRQYLHQEQGEVKYFDTMEEAEECAKNLTSKKNHSMARAAYKFTARLVKEETMSIGSKFLQRVTEAEAPAASEIKLDTVWKGLHSRLKRPYEKKIVELFSMLGIPGRYVANEEGLDDAIRTGGDIIRRAGRKQTAFNAFYDAIKNGGVQEAKKAGSRIQKVLETVLVTLGFPESMVTTEGGGPLITVLRRAASRIEQNSAAEGALISLAKALGLSSAQVNEGQLVPHKMSVKQWYDLLKDVEELSPKEFRDEEYLVDRIYAIDSGADGAMKPAALKQMASKVKAYSAQVSESKTIKVKEQGWYVVNHMDKAVAGPFTESRARNECAEMNIDHIEKHGKGDIKPYDILFYSDYDIKRMKRMNESTLGSKFLNRVIGEDIDVGQDDFMEAAMALALAIGIPEQILAPRRAMLVKALREKKMSLANRGMIQQRMIALTQLIEKGTKATPGQDVDNLKEALKEGLLMEAFGPLEAVVGKSLDMFNALEPAAGPAMMAEYEGSGAHEETVLIVAVDPDAPDDNKSLRVGIDGPWDGEIWAKHFVNTKEGYKAAIDYANMLRTANLKTGGRPKGWKDSVPEIKRLPADDSKM